MRNATPIALCAWAGYLDQGRGVVCIEVAENNKVQHELPGFISEAKASSVIHQWHGSKEASMIAGYCPEYEVVVMFIRAKKNGRVDYDTYRYTSSLTPCKAYDLWFMNPDMWTLEK